ncbi:hydroxyacylglutathione hydrolase [Marinobacter zhanjiangensis]|uniref:Hydroxyacylglutathione hydrolase n=1 Tax=Marinobacter zhanjiangensis TaxID=578215 RepID=A0ABQ3B6Q1_9GAMM|nr:hydroxyacylglutathione hydrolase [Marinobacter zhanjiangensis]GGY82193.1 hydroxyacylglutathione hydrolase [Marinobacter zhanjiangensis]
MLTITPIPAFSDNYIWCLADTDSRKALIVDPGQAKPVADYLTRNQLALDTILVTHHHPDHTGGIATLRDQFNPTRIVAPANSPFTGGTDTVHPGDQVVWQSLTFQVLDTPGHTLDHIAFFCDTPVAGRPALFCGDTLFACGCGRLFEGTPGQMVESLASLRALPDDTAVFCAHEYTLANLRFARSWLPDDPALAAFEEHCQALRDDDRPTVPVVLGDEKQRNPFLRWDDPIVIRAAEAYGREHNLVTDSDSAVFAAVRHGKDNF